MSYWRIARNCTVLYPALFSRLKSWSKHLFFRHHLWVKGFDQRCTRRGSLVQVQHRPLRKSARLQVKGTNGRLTGGKNTPRKAPRGYNSSEGESTFNVPADSLDDLQAPRYFAQLSLLLLQTAQMCGLCCFISTEGRGSVAAYFVLLPLTIPQGGDFTFNTT